MTLQILQNYEASPTRQITNGKIYLLICLLLILLTSFSRQTQAQVCSLSVTALPSDCNPATNTYSTTAVVYLSNTVSGTVTVTDGTRNIIAAIPSGVTSASFSATFTNIPADGIVHTVTASQPGCTTATTTYPAPVACGVCSLTATTTPGACASATNTYSATTVVELTNPTPGLLTVTNGTQSLTTTVPAGYSNYTFRAGFNGLTSDGAEHTVTVTLPGCGTTTSTYPAPASCSVIGVCSVSAMATASVCNTATNTYSSTVVATVLNPTSGATLLLTDGTVSQPFTTSAASQNTFIAVFSGFTSNGDTHTVTASIAGCGSFTTSYPAPTCSGACSVSVASDRSVCDAATNTYSSTIVATVLNPNGGTITISDGGLSQTFSTTAVNQNTFTAVFTGLPSNGVTHTVIASLPGCSTSTTSYTAPISCSATPVCSIDTPLVTAGGCASATNTYSVTAVVTIQNPSGGTLTISNGITSQPFTTTTGSSNTFTMIFNGLTSDGLSHIITANLSGCGSTTAAYPAPAACLAAPVCSMTPVITVGACASATNTYSTTAVIVLTNPPAGVLTVTDGTRSLTTTIASSLGSFTFTATFNGLIPDATTHTVIASLPGCTDVTATYPAPASCSATPICSVSAMATQGSCASATNTFSNTIAVTLTNPSAGVLTVTDGTASLTFTVPATLGTVTAPAIFNGLPSNGSARTVIASLSGCSSTTLNYTAQTSCTSTTVCPAFILSPNPLPNGYVGVAYSSTLAASGGTAPYTFSISSGLLPTGLILSTNGTLSGNPSAPGSYSVVVRVTDSKGCYQEFNPGTLAISCLCRDFIPVLQAQMGTPYSANMDGYSIVSGNLPPGLTLSPTGVLSGTPTTDGNFNFSLNDPTNTTTGCSCQNSYAMVVNPSITPACSISAAVTAGTCASATNTYSATAVVTLNNPPAGVLTVSNGVQSLTTTIASGLSSYTFTGSFDGLNSDGATHTITASLSGCTDQTFTYPAPVSCFSTTTCPPFTLSPSALPDGMVGTPYNVTIVASGGSSPYSFSVSSGSLPAGITLSPNGVLSGTPSATGSFGIRVLTADNQGCLQELDPGILTIMPSGSGPCSPVKCMPLVISRIR